MEKRARKNWSKADNYQLLRIMNTPDKEKAIIAASKLFNTSLSSIRCKYRRLTNKNAHKLVPSNTISNRKTTSSRSIMINNSNVMALPITKVDVDTKKGMIYIHY